VIKINGETYLKHHKEKIQVVKRCETYFSTKEQKYKISANWQNKEHSYDGNFSDDLCLMSIPANLIIIEFEYPQRALNNKFILDSAVLCNKHELQFGIYDHKGKSPYLYVRF